MIGPDDLRTMIDLARVVTVRAPHLLNGEVTIGELAWTWGKDHPTQAATWTHRIWYDAGEPVAFGWTRLPHTVRRADGSTKDVTRASLVWQTHPDRHELFDEILDWYDAQAAGLTQEIGGVQRADTEAISRVEARGYRPLAGYGHLTQLNQRPLDDVEVPVLPAGFRFRTAADVGAEAAVTAHREAWYPSTYTDLSYAGVREACLYRPDLHVLVEAPDGRMAANTIMWYDPVTRTAEFEPVGTHRDFRRQGLARALLLHGMHRVRDAGAATMFVACLSGDTDVAARRLYESIGFREISRDAALYTRS